MHDLHKTHTGLCNGGTHGEFVLPFRQSTCGHALLTKPKGLLPGCLAAGCCCCAECYSQVVSALFFTDGSRCLRPKPSFGTGSTRNIQQQRTERLWAGISLSASGGAPADGQDSPQPEVQAATPDLALCTRPWTAGSATWLLKKTEWRPPRQRLLRQWRQCACLGSWTAMQASSAHG